MLPDLNDPAPIVRLFAAFTAWYEALLADWLTRRLGHRNAKERAGVLIKVAPKLWAMPQGGAGENAEATTWDDAIRPSYDEVVAGEAGQ